jgi:hypothetical protein
MLYRFGPNRILLNEVSKGEGEDSEEEHVDHDTKLIKRWRKMGFVDKTYVQEVIDDMIYNTNRKKEII